MNILTLPISSRDRRQGNIAASVTLVKYGDYQCPASADARLIVQEIQQLLGNRLCFVYRHFPQVELYPRGQHAAEAAEAAANQGKFWQMHNHLFTHQDTLDDGFLVEYAAELNLDVQRFLREVTGDFYVQRVLEDRESGRKSGVRRTPAFFINGYLYDSDWDRDSLLNALYSILDDNSCK